jgi:hypothetical protein
MIEPAGRIETSTSGGTQSAPSGLPAAICVYSDAGIEPSSVIGFHDVSNATPFSLPTHRTSGPTSLNIAAIGWSSRTELPRVGPVVIVEPSIRRRSRAPP